MYPDTSCPFDVLSRMKTMVASFPFLTASSRSASACAWHHLYTVRSRHAIPERASILVRHAALFHLLHFSCCNVPAQCPHLARQKRRCLAFLPYLSSGSTSSRICQKSQAFFSFQSLREALAPQFTSRDSRVPTPL
jgi:hypothetical protein